MLVDMSGGRLFAAAQSLGLALSLAACGSATATRSTEAPNSSEQRPVAACDVETQSALAAASSALEAGRALLARSTLDALTLPGEVARSAACTLQVLTVRAQTSATLGDCPTAHRDGFTGECTPAPAISPRQGIEQAAALRAAGKSTEANLTLARAFVAVKASGAQIKAVPAWLTGSREVKFIPPAQFVVQHEAGISVLGLVSQAEQGSAAQELEETRRCDVKEPLQWLSPAGHFAKVGDTEPRLLDLQSCRLLDGSVPIAFAADESGFLRVDAGTLSHWRRGADAPSWTLPFTPDTRTCLSADGAQLLLAEQDRAPVLYDAIRGTPKLTLSERLEHDPQVAELRKRLPKRRTGSKIGDLAPKSCEFSPDGTRVALSSHGPALLSEIWDTQSGDLKLAGVAGLERISSSLSTAIFPRLADEKVSAVLHSSPPRDETRPRLEVPANTTLGAYENTRQLLATTHSPDSAQPAEWCVWDFDTAEPFHCITLSAESKLVFGEDGSAFAIRDHASLQVFTRSGAVGERFAIGNHKLRLLDSNWAVLGGMTGIPSSLWNIRGGTRMRVLSGEAPPGLYFERDYVCLSPGCLVGNEYSFAFPTLSYANPPWVVIQDPADALSAFESLRITAARALGTEAQIPVIMQSQDAAQIWALTPDYRLHVLSAKGVLQRSVDLQARFGRTQGASPPTGRSDARCESWHITPIAFEALHGNRLLIQASTLPGCTFLVELGRESVTALPVVSGKLLAVSADGQRLALHADGALQVRNVRDGRKLAAIAVNESVRAGLSFSGDSIVVVEDVQTDDRGPWHVQLRVFESTGKALPVAPELQRALNPARTQREWQLGPRMFALANELFDYRGQFLARVTRQGTQAVATFADGTVEQFGRGESKAYRCQVNTEILPAEFCADALERPGTLHNLAGPRSPGADLLWHERAFQRAAAAPKPPLSCRFPIAACGRDHNVYARELSCKAEEFSSASLACLTQVNVLELEGLTELPPTATLARIEGLVLPKAVLRDYRELGKLKQLRLLELPHSNIQSLAQLGEFPELHSLILTGTQISELDVLRYPKLQVLDIADTAIPSLLPLLNLPTLLNLTIAKGQFPQAELDALEASARTRHLEVRQLVPASSREL